MSRINDRARGTKAFALARWYSRTNTCIATVSAASVWRKKPNPLALCTSLVPKYVIRQHYCVLRSCAKSVCLPSVPPPHTRNTWERKIWLSISTWIPEVNIRRVRAHTCRSCLTFVFLIQPLYWSYAMHVYCTANTKVGMYTYMSQIIMTCMTKLNKLKVA